MIESAKWIGCESGKSVPVIRRELALDKPVSGFIEITGLGFFTLLINGQWVTKDRFTPALTDYEPRDMRHWGYPLYDETRHRILYLRYDISDFLLSGKNLLEIRLGGGWYNQDDRSAEGNTSFGKNPKAIFAMQVTEKEGQAITILSNGEEKWAPSEIRYSSLFYGEKHDAGIFSQAPVLTPVTVLPAPEAELNLQDCPPDRIIRSIRPVEIGKDGSRRIFDCGENIAGVARITAGGMPDSTITIRYSEEIHPDGSLDFQSTGSDYVSRSGVRQIQSDTFICDDKKRIFEPEFVWHGFRYLDVEGEFDDLTVDVIHTDVAVTSGFSCDNPTLNWLYESYIRTQLDNIHGCIPSDCPHRERLGYTGDGQMTAKTAMLVLDVQGVYRKWIRDILDCQDTLTGHVQHTAPAMGGGGGPGGYGSAIVIVPDEYARHYGDMSLLETCYPHMLKWIGYMKAHCEHCIVTSEEKDGWCLGDWASVGPMELPAPYVNTAYLLYCLRRVSWIARKLGHNADVLSLDRFAAKVQDAILREFYDPETGSFCGGIQGADAYAVCMSFAPDGRTAENLNRKYASLGTFDTGFIATELLVSALFQTGHADTAFRLLTSPEKGSYDYERTHGATTIWEYFHGGESHNHPMFGAPVRHLFEDILGIHQEDIGYSSPVIAPKIPAGLTRASGSIQVPSGTVHVAWEKQENILSLKITLPVPGTLVFNGQTQALTAGSHDFRFEI